MSTNNVITWEKLKANPVKHEAHKQKNKEASKKFRDAHPKTDEQKAWALVRKKINYDNRTEDKIMTDNERQKSIYYADVEKSRGYTKDNIQVISYKANTMKNNATIEELKLFSNWINITFGTGV